jgi:hypothetical protein
MTRLGDAALDDTVAAISAAPISSDFCHEAAKSRRREQNMFSSRLRVFVAFKADARIARFINVLLPKARPPYRTPSNTSIVS